MSKDTNRHSTKRARRRESPNLPGYPSPIPGMPGYVNIRVARFWVDLFVHPTLYNWLLVLRFFGGFALALAALFTVAFLQTSGLSWWSLGAGALVIALIALEYICWRAARRLHQKR